MGISNSFPVTLRMHHTVNNITPNTVQLMKKGFSYNKCIIFHSTNMAALFYSSIGAHQLFPHEKFESHSTSKGTWAGQALQQTTID